MGNNSTQIGRRARDAGWDRLRSAIEKQLLENRRNDRAPGTSAELAAALFLPTVTVSNWLMRPKARGNPELSQVPQIAAALVSGYPDDQRDAAASTVGRLLAESLGVIDSKELAAELAISVHRLRTRLLDMQDSIAQLGHLAGVPAITRRAVDKGWAVAIWPAFEGPKHGPILHVADRIDFRRPGGDVVQHADVWRDFGDLLRQVGASPTTSEWSTPRWVEFRSTESVSGWGIPRVGAPSPSRVQSIWGTRLSAVTVVSASIAAWPNDLASHIADTIGYGMTSTMDVMLDVYGLLSGELAVSALNELQSWLIGRPPVKRVWSHVSPDDPLQQLRDGRPPADGLVVFWLHESDEHLRIAAKQAEGLGDADYTTTLNRLHKARDQGDETATALAGQGVWHLSLSEPEGTTLVERRQSRWQTVFDLTAEAVRLLLDDGRIPGSREILRRWWDANNIKDQTPSRAVRVQQHVSKVLQT